MHERNAGSGAVASKRVAVFIGTRPECIKLAPVVRALERSTSLDVVSIVTGQHREMLVDALSTFGLDFGRQLAVMEHDQTLASLTARLVSEVDRTLASLQPAFALVQGDTTTALATALACFYRRVPLGHVEAGLRSNDRGGPFPEETNRVLITHLAEHHFCPTEAARDNLLREGVSPERVYVSGNTGIDALRMELDRRPDVSRAVSDLLGSGWDGMPFVLVTAHRRESFGDGIVRICDAVRDLAGRFGDVRFVFPVHPNPNVQRPIREQLGRTPNVRLVPPLPYPQFVALLRRCRVVLTDSGGVQEEAASLGRPVLVLRDSTERPEGVAAGVSRLVGTRAEHIVETVTHLLSDDASYAAMARPTAAYGDGRAAGRIVGRLEELLAGR